MPSPNPTGAERGLYLRPSTASERLPTTTSCHKLPPPPPAFLASINGANPALYFPDCAGVSLPLLQLLAFGILFPDVWTVNDVGSGWYPRCQWCWPRGVWPGVFVPNSPAALGGSHSLPLGVTLQNDRKGLEMCLCRC